MTKAQDWVIKNSEDYVLEKETAFNFAERAYNAGATENGIQWHDLFHAQNVFNDEYIQPTFVEYVQKLEKENAELEEKLEMGIALKDEEIGCIQTGFNTFKSKAKELLKRYVPYRQITDSKAYKDLAEETEQFLKENA